MTYEVTLVDETVEWVEGADSFQLEGPLTTFFRTDGGRPMLDRWSTKLASFRTDRIAKIRRCLPAPGAPPRDSDHELRTFANGL